ncbi:MAG TPA: Ig-like domain-containing protein, partial [Casimicrobiaceae bacterium]
GTGAAGGNVQVWLAHTGERCPVTPGDAPVAAKTLTAALGAGSDVKFMFGDLGIDHYQVCATYAGDVRYNPVSAGPYDLFVIKGALLGAPTVAIAAPAAVKARQLVSAKVAVNAPAQSTLAPSGSVLLRANGVAVGTLALSGGVATFNTTAPGTPGTLTLTASYLGDGAFPPALSAPAVVAVTKADPAEAVPVPMLSAAALAMLALALAALGMVFRRRRRGG